VIARSHWHAAAWVGLVLAGCSGGDRASQVPDAAMSDAVIDAAMNESSSDATPEHLDAGVPPSGGLQASDLDGTGLADFSPVTSATVHADTGEIDADGVTVCPATSGDAGARDVQAGIAYRRTPGGMAIFTFASLNVPEGATVQVVGALPAALVSAMTATRRPVPSRWGRRRSP
jgi:hypothetical protein